MTRTALTCPSCGRVLAYKRRGGSVVPEPRVLVVYLGSGLGTVMECPQARCEGIIPVGGDRVVIPPRTRATITSN